MTSGDRQDQSKASNAQRTVTGTVSVHARGFGFVEWSEEGKRRSAFLNPRLVRSLLHLDRVEARVEDDRKGLAVRDVTLLERPRDTLFGVLRKDGRGKLVLEPDPEVANQSWKVGGGISAEPGQHVIGRIHDDVVHLESVVPEEEVALQRVRDRYQIRHPFTAEVEQDARDRKARRATGWRDLRDLCTVTIDAPVSRDLDDALSVHPAGPDGAVRLFVHIADVSGVVTEGSLVDEEARKRGTSVYLAGAVTPMLPRTLSEDKLSLLPGKDRRAMTAELRVDAEGEVTSVDIYPSTIRSDGRLSYEEVDQFLSGHDLDLDDDILDTLSWLRTVSGRLAAVRAARGGVSFDRQELRIELDDDMEPVQIMARAQTPAHLLIERTMVAANEAVAGWMRDRGLPGVFRIHPAPGADRVAELEASLERMGFTPGLASPLTPRSLAALDAQLRDAGMVPVLQEVLAQILDRARYTVHLDGHFGLASSAYLHFTSPIRRYADLMVHRIIKAWLDGRRDWDPVDGEMEELAVHLNGCTARSAKAEAARRRMLTARWAQQHTDEPFDGHVIAVKPFGLIVQLQPSGVTGVLPTDDLPGSWRHEGHQLVGEGDTWAIGDPIAVKIAQVDEDRGRIDLAPHTRSRKRRRRRRKRS